MSGTITAEFYEYDLSNLNDTANTVRASVEENGTCLLYTSWGTF